MPSITLYHSLYRIGAHHHATSGVPYPLQDKYQTVKQDSQVLSGSTPCLPADAWCTSLCISAKLHYLLFSTCVPFRSPSIPLNNPLSFSKIRKSNWIIY